MKIIYNVFISFDQLLNTLLLGHPDETISSRLGRSIKKEKYFWIKPLRVLVDTIFFFDTEAGMSFEGGYIIRHCEKSVMPLEQQNFRELIDYEIWNWNKED